MFLGEYQHTLDAKGRLSLPAKFRSSIGPKVVVCKGPEGCLYVYSEDGYERFMGRITERGELDTRFQGLRRFFTAGATDVEVDSAGRISITPKLREHAHLDRDVVVIGNGARVEIWDTEAWDVYSGKITENIGEMTEQLSSLGLL